MQGCYDATNKQGFCIMLAKDKLAYAKSYFLTKMSDFIELPILRKRSINLEDMANSIITKQK